MSGETIHKRYAKALMLASDEKDLEMLDRQLIDVRIACLQSSSLFLRAMQNPSIKHEEKVSLLTWLCKKLTVLPVIEKFIMLLLEKGRFAEIEGISKAFSMLLDRRMGRARAHMVTAQPLAKETQTQIMDALQQHTGKTIIAESKVDESLLGGVWLKIGGLVFDGTLKANLKNLSERLVA